MAIKIPVSAQFDAASLKQQIQMVNDQIRAMASQVGQANKQSFNPISVRSKEDLDAFTKQLQKMLKIQTELAQQMNKSGQAGKNPLMADWSKMYTDQAVRMKKMQSMLQFLGVEFDNNSPTPKPKPPAVNAQPPAVRPQSPQGGSNGSGWGSQGMSVLNSGLRAAGPVGGVFSGALNSGLSGGAGAGLMGLVGGLAALGVGKVIGAIADKISTAQDNAIGLDRIYRQIGGIASYSSLKSQTSGVADRLGMTTSDAIGLASTYSRAANLRQGDNLATGMLVSGGLARSYGMDPNEAAGMMGSMQGANIGGRGDQQMRRMGLLIGETIGKSNAFAKAGDMMQAISGYALAQARQSLTSPNIAGYGGAISSLMSSNIPGLDVAGSAGLLGAANAAISKGGAMGDASQFLGARTAMANGMSPMQMRVLQEGGMFATMSGSLGKGSLYGQTTGHGKEGNKTLFEMRRAQLRKNYGAGTDQYYIAMANDMGIGVSQAMALDKMDTKQIGGASNRLSRLGLDINKVNAASMGTLGQIESGKGLAGMAQGYLKQGGKNALSGDERQALLSAYKGTDPEKLKDALTEIASKRGAVETEGSQIRDGVAQLDNHFTAFADKALPALNVMRMAAVNATGGSEAELRKRYAEREMGDRTASIDARYKGPMDAARARNATAYGSGTAADKKATDAEVKTLNDKRNAEIAAARADVNKAMGTGASAAEAAGDTTQYGDSPSAAAADGSGGPTGKNNVGNVRVSATDKRFRDYSSLQDSVQGMSNQLLRYGSGAYQKNYGKRDRTLRQLITRYAPPSENDTAGYIKFVSEKTGINPDKEIDLTRGNTLRDITRWMAVKEGPKGKSLTNGELTGGVNAALGNKQAYEFNHSVDVVLHHPDGTKQTVKPELKTYKPANTFAQRQNSSWNN